MKLRLCEPESLVYIGFRFQHLTYLSCFKQIVVSLGSGPWDQLFGGGNSPAFAVAAVAALLSGLLALLAIPRTRTQKPRIRV